MTETLLEFPCAFPLKIMGRTQDGFAQAVVAVVRRHAPDFDPATLEMRSASRGAGFQNVDVPRPRVDGGVR